MRGTRLASKKVEKTPAQKAPEAPAPAPQPLGFSVLCPECARMISAMRDSLHPFMLNHSRRAGGGPSDLCSGGGKPITFEMAMGAKADAVHALRKRTQEKDEADEALAEAARVYEDRMTEATRAKDRLAVVDKIVQDLMPKDGAG